jgi:hypothetical protein
MMGIGYSKDKLIEAHSETLARGLELQRHLQM